MAVDSFVSITNKSVETEGNGEARLHLGTKGSDADEFFGPESSPLEIRLFRKNLLQLVDYLEPLYRSCYLDYRGGRNLLNLWEERRARVDQLSDIVRVSAIRKPYRDSDPRAYLSSSDPLWDLLRELPLSRSAIFRISRTSSAHVFDLHAAPLSHIDPESLLAAEELAIYDPESAFGGNSGLETFETVVERIAQTRRGQQAFKRDVLKRMPVCPFTGISDVPLLRASHIKPWRDSTNAERLDARNGLTLSPTYDVLFDLGYVSFSGEGALLVSRQLPGHARRVLALSDGSDVLPREIAAESSEFLAYHRERLFLE